MSVQPAPQAMAQSAEVLPFARTRVITRDLRAGDVLFREGDTAQRLYEVTKGVLRMTRMLSNGRRVIVGFAYSGDFVGFAQNGVHHTDCDALAPTGVVAHRNAMLRDASGDPTLRACLLEAALREMTLLQDHLVTLNRKSAPEKVASFLDDLAQRIGTSLGQFTRIELPMARADIADFLGLSTETVCRSLTRLRKARIIHLENIHTVVVLKPDELRRIADPEGVD